MNRKNIWNSLLLAVALVVLATACKEDDPGELNLKRNFTPAVIEVEEGETQAMVQWSRSLFAEAGTVEYQVELSKTVDFATVAFTATTTDTELAVTDADIEIRTDYFARVKVLAEGTVGESGYVVSEAFQITGEQIFLPLAESDIIDNAAILSWTFQAGITSIVITPEGGDPVEYAVTTDESNDARKLIDDLSGNTNYTAEIFKGDVSKGTIQFTTKAPLEGDNIVDLRSITGDPNVLMDTLATNFADGSIFVLKRGLTYNLSTAVNVNKSFTIVSGADFVPELATIFFTSNFNLEASANAGTIVFKDLYMYSDNYSGRYVFNINQVGSIGKIEFQNCKIHRFRGILRLQTGGAGTQ
ncbi:MAG: hypothetical protein HC859_15225 [Bacteroidia bacterium]|nr:hypothetical protein [Bacteroidia bacterium]